MDIITQLHEELPLLNKLHLGHTPLQIKHFKTSQQKGSKKFEYWQHLIQIKALARSVQELRLEVEEAEVDLKALSSIWSLQSRAKKNVLKKKQLLKIEGLNQSLADRELELSRHMEVVKSDYSDLLNLSEDELMEAEAEYWVQRLSRQLAFSKIALEKGIGAGDVASIAALPKDLGERILNQTQALLTSGEIWEQKQLEGK